MQAKNTQSALPIVCFLLSKFLLASLEHMRYHTGVSKSPDKLKGISNGGHKQNKKASHQNGRLASSMAQGPSRVSKAAGGIGSKGAQMEQRSNMPSSRSTPTPKNTLPARQRQANNGRNGGQGRGGNQGTRKAAGPNNSHRPDHATPNNPAPASATRDTRFIHWVRETWNGMEAHHQKRFLGVICSCYRCSCLVH